MPPPPRPGFNPEPARSDEEHRQYKIKKAGELVDRMLAEKDPVIRRQLEDELATRDPHHYDIPVQPGWPLHDWPYKGPEFTKESVPKSHFIARRHLPPENQTYKRPSFALDKYECVQDYKGLLLKFNPRRRVIFFLAIVTPMFLSWKLITTLWYNSDVRAGRIPRHPGIYHNFSKKIATRYN